MSKYIIFILIFNCVCYVQNSDIYKISDHKTVDKFIIKRFDHENLPKPKEPSETDTKANIPKPNISETKLPNPTPEHKNAPSADVSKISSNDEKSSKSNSNEKDSVKKQLAQQDLKNNTKTEPESKKNATETESGYSVPVIKGNHHGGEHPGAFMRGFYVFLGLSIIIIIYFGIKFFRLRPGAPPSTTVRKYGVVGRRSDMEMLPLPLAEEDDDDTLFDMGTQVNR